MRTRTRPRIRPGLSTSATAALLGSLTLVLAACGGGDDPGAQVASLGASATTATDGSASAATDGTTATTLDPEDALLAFAQCMRDHGVDMPDPQTDGQGRGIVQVGSAGEPEDRSQLDAAQQACQHFMDESVQARQGTIDPEEEAEHQQQALDFAQCMRDHGIDFPDPVFGDNGTVSISLGDPGGGGVDPQSSEFQAAQQACSDEVGGFIGAGPGGAGATQTGGSTGSGGDVEIQSGSDTGKAP